MSLEITDLLNILTLSLAITSSSIAVIVGIFLREVLKSRQERKKVMSMFVAHLHSVHSQIWSAKSLFQLLSENSSWSDETLPNLIQAVDSWARPIKTGF